MQPTLHLGQTLEFPSNPFHAGVESIRHRSHGAVLVSGGRIEAVGEATALRAAHPHALIQDHGRHLILPGFVDAHAHYSQTAIIASWGKRLIDWLNTYTFPEEMRFEDPGYAAEVAGRYLDLNLSNGITTACAYCTIHPTSVDALMDAAQRRGMAMVAGKVMMNRNAPEGLRDTAQRGFDESAALIARWHETDRLRYAITPRFAPTSSPEQLEAAGALFAAHPSCDMQTHLSEQLEEIAWVRDLFPEARDYFDVYARFGLVGPGAIMGHAIHLSDR
ncbi:MAG: guanine deaminase, partial [Pseudomonadota bacterium]